MFHKQMQQFISNTYLKGEKVEIFKEEKEYAVKHALIPNDTELVTEKDPGSRFGDAYIERCDKESENLLANETASFLNHPITYLKKHKNEFIYVESNWFELLGVEAVSLEVDDVFGTYDVMLGLRMQKKYGESLKGYLNTALAGDSGNFELMFSSEDGLWNVNFDLNFVQGFNEEISLNEAYQLIYRFLFQLVEAMEA
jgi:hypothetical protein